ncbi:MAG: hypothetical protein L0387_20530 [Acidobacteria bacterium]|nr:hypothetical protein [Acidobacteriota bacterium]
MTIRTFRLMVWLCAAASLPATAMAGPLDVRLQMDVRRQTGPVPYTYRAGVFLNSLPAGYPKEMFLAEQRPGMVEFSWDYYAPLAQANTEPEFFARLPQSNLAAWVRETAAAGGEPYIKLMPIPKWLWSGGNGFRKPPRDLQGWERFVERLVDHFNNQLKIDARYIVWDEPNGFWEGTTEDYLQLYKHAAAGLLKANPKARIGGPATSKFNSAIGKGNPPLLPTFVQYCASTPLPGLAERLPINMLVWHTFDAAPVSPGQYELEVKAARALLRQHGYRENVELNVGSWAALEQYPELGTNVRDSEFLAAFVVSSVIAMQGAGVDRHAFFNLYEDWRSNREEFSDDIGLTTMSYVTKAGYHAYRLLGRLKGDYVPLSVSDPFVQAAAGRDGKTLRVVVSNFAPPNRMLRMLTQRRLVASGHHHPSELKKMLPDREKLKQMLQDRKRIEAWNVPADVRAAALRLHDAVRLSTERQREALGLEIRVDGLPNGRYRLREYRVDGSSGNPFRQRETVERQAKQRRIEEINATTREAAVRPRENQPIAQVSGTYSWRTSLPPYGVMLLEAERLD